MPDDVPQALTPSAIAADWGTSRAYASQCVAKGCPTNSLEAAREWRVKKSVRGVGYRSKARSKGAGQPETAAPDAESGASSSSPNSRPHEQPDSIDASLQAAIDVEHEAHRLVQEAQRVKDDEKLALRINAYTKALDGRLSAEAQVLKIKERAGVLVTSDFAKELIRRAWLPLLTRLRSIPKRAAIRANPSDDVMAEAVIHAEIEEAIKEAQGAFA